MVCLEHQSQKKTTATLRKNEPKRQTTTVAINAFMYFNKSLDWCSFLKSMSLPELKRWIDSSRLKKRFNYSFPESKFTVVNFGTTKALLCFIWMLIGALMEPGWMIFKCTPFCFSCFCGIFRRAFFFFFTYSNCLIRCKTIDELIKKMLHLGC